MFISLSYLCYITFVLLLLQRDPLRKSGNVVPNPKPLESPNGEERDQRDDSLAEKNKVLEMELAQFSPFI